MLPEHLRRLDVLLWLTFSRIDSAVELHSHSRVGVTHELPLPQTKSAEKLVTELFPSKLQVLVSLNNSY
jgi:hypothetical protein